MIQLADVPAAALSQPAAPRARPLPPAPPEPSVLIERAGASAGRPVEVELVLRCARTRLNAADRARISDLISSGVDWEFAVDLACAHGVVSLVRSSLREAASAAVPPDVDARLRRVSHGLVALSQIRIEALLALIRDCEAEGVEVLPFKGPAFGTLYYGDPFRRKPGGDLDILTRRNDFATVRDILIRRGYRPRVPVEREARYLRTRSGSTFEHDEGHVDLHWTLESQPFDGLPISFRLDPDRVRARSVPVTLGGTVVRTLRAEDALLYLCAHGAKHSWTSLYSVADVAELVRHTPRLNWAEVTAEADRQRAGRVLHLGLLLAQGLLGAVFPDEIRQRLEADRWAQTLAFQVASEICDPDSTAGDRHHDWAGTVRVYRYRLSLLERPTTKVMYLVFRTLRMLGRRMTSAGGRGVDGE